MITLKVAGPYGEHGWEDKDGVQFYNSVTMSPWGPIGNLKTRLEDDVLVILQAPEVILVSKTFARIRGTVDGFGVTWIDVIGRNGHVRYQVLDEPVEWEDKPGEEATMSVALLGFSEWTPESEYTEELRREIITVPVEASE